MSVNVYSAYGLTIRTNMPCPELPLHPHPQQEPDVIIRLRGNTPQSICPSQEGAFEVLPGQFRLHIPGVARYSVDEGKRILIEPFAGSSPDAVRLFLWGSTMGALLYQRGLFPLHGSAVETPMGAMIFVGAQGSGKSTLAAEFLRRGYRLLSDDICALEATAEGFRVLPALAQLRLCPDAYGRLGEPPTARLDSDKLVLSMGKEFCPGPVPLRSIHILSNHDTDVPRLEVLHGFDRVQFLLENLYRPQFLKGQHTQRHLMKMAGMIAKVVVMAVVRRRRDRTNTADLVRFLESAWAEFPESALLEKN